jgi:hypothetical protein
VWGYIEAFIKIVTMYQIYDTRFIDSKETRNQIVVSEILILERRDDSEQPMLFYLLLSVHLYLITVIEHLFYPSG